MEARAITFVEIESVARESLVIVEHDEITRDFGYYGSGGDREGF